MLYRLSYNGAHRAQPVIQKKKGQVPHDARGKAAQEKENAGLDRCAYFALGSRRSGGCSSVVERQIVDLVVVGSNPITHPVRAQALVAQVDRATDFESVGRTFKSCRAHLWCRFPRINGSVLVFPLTR